MFLFILNGILAGGLKSFGQSQQLIDSLLNQLHNLSSEKAKLKLSSSSLFDTSAANILLELSRIYRDNNPKLALVYANRSLTLSQQINFKKGIGNAYNSIGLCLNNTGDFTQSISNINKSLEIRSEINDSAGMAFCYNNFGGIYFGVGNYTLALKNHLAALKIREKINDNISIASSYHNIGMVYLMQGIYPEAQQNFEKALKINKASGNKPWQSANLGSMGLIKLHQEKYSEALILFYESVDILRQTDDLYNLAGAYLNIGETYTGLKKYSQAIVYYKSALDLSIKMEDKDGQAISYMCIGSVYVKQNRFNSGAEFLGLGLNLAKETGNIEVLRNCYEAYAKMDSAQGNFSKEAAHYKLFIMYRDSIMNSENTKKAMDLKLKYETEKNEQQIALLNKDKLIKQKELSKKTTQRNGFLGAFVLVAMIGGVTYNRFLIKQRANNKLSSALAQLQTAQQQLIEQENMASLGQLTAGIAHEIQNPLNFIINFSELSSDLFKELEDSQLADEQQAIISDMEDNLLKIERHGLRAEGIIKNMLMHDGNSNSYKSLVNLNELCNEAISFAMQDMQIRHEGFICNLSINYQDNIPMIYVVRQDVLRVLINLFSNAFYAVQEKFQNRTDTNYEPQVSVATYRLQDCIHLKIADNGTGIKENIKSHIFQPFFTTKPTNLGTGLGLSISYDIVKVHSGNLTLDNTSTKGSTFLLSLPI